VLLLLLLHQASYTCCTSHANLPAPSDGFGRIRRAIGNTPGEPKGARLPRLFSFVAHTLGVCREDVARAEQ
jgi:hypothetical protein